MESSSAHLSGGVTLKESLKNPCQIVKAIYLTQMMTLVQLKEVSGSARNLTTTLQGWAGDMYLMWKDMSNYVGRRERFVGNSSPQNEVKNVTEGVDAFKMFFTQEVIEIITPEEGIGLNFKNNLYSSLLP
jgi:hypothetical protein